MKKENVENIQTNESKLVDRLEFWKQIKWQLVLRIGYIFFASG